MRARNYVIGGLCSAVIVAHGASTPGGNDPALSEDGLDVVPEENLKDMRGGVDLGNLVGYFAIDRVVQVDGQVVAKMQIVVSNLDKLSTGGMPTISVSGPLAELVQVMNGPAGASGANGAVVAAAKSLAEPRSTEAARGTAGSIGSTGGAGLSVGAGAAGQPVGGSFTVNIGSGSTVVPAAGGLSPIASNVQVVPQGAAGAAGSASTTAGGGGQSAADPETISKIIPIGNTGQFVVLSNLPNAAGIATAVQNEVRGTTVQVQTTISAQLNSLTLLNSLALANAIRTQISLPTGH